jgi:MFS family permease
VDSARPGFRSALVAFRYRNFALFWTGALLSNTGTWVQNITVPFVVFQLTSSPLWVGVAAFTQLLPLALFSVVGGALADRHQRRTILLVTQSVSALLALALWAVWTADRASLPVVLVLVGAGGAVSGLNIPAWQAFVTELVPRNVLLNAVTLNSTQFNAARAFGPALGGLVLARLGVGWAFLLNAGSYLVVLAVLLAISVPPLVRTEARQSVLRGLTSSVAYARRHRGLATCIVSVAGLGLLASPINSLLVVFAEDVFAVDRFRYGLFGAALGVGAVIAAPLVAGPGTGVRRSLLAGGGMVVHGAALFGFAIAPTYAVALALLVVAGAAYLPIAATLNTTLQLQVQEARRGKVLALYITVFTVAIPVGSLLQGALADVVGARLTVAVAAGSYLAAVAVLTTGGWLRTLDSTDMVGTTIEPGGDPAGTASQASSGS